ncbi:hypothetical protein Bca101_082997 [Brassica carinata]
MTTYTSLSYLKPDPENKQSIQVKLLRHWKIKLQSPGLYNLKLILVDSEVSCLTYYLVLCYTSLSVLNNLIVYRTNVGRTRTTANIFKVKFTVSTLLYFYPTNFADIIHRRLDFKTSVDFIGIIVSSTPLKFLLNDKTKINNLAFLSFSIEDDSECILECQAVGVVAVEFERERVRAQQHGEPGICLLHFWHINQFPDGACPAVPEVTRKLSYYSQKILQAWNVQSEKTNAPHRSTSTPTDTTLPSTNFAYQTSIDTPALTSIDTQPRDMVATLILRQDENRDLRDQEGYLRNAAGQKLDAQGTVIPEPDATATRTLADYNRPD